MERGAALAADAHAAVPKWSRLFGRVAQILNFRADAAEIRQEFSENLVRIGVASRTRILDNELSFLIARS
jgi:hypothetical protein